MPDSARVRIPRTDGMPAKRLVSPGEKRVSRTLQGRVGDARQITSGLAVAKLRKRSSRRLKYFAVTSYDSQAFRERLERHGLVDGVAWKGRRNQPLEAWQKLMNAWSSSIRCGLERQRLGGADADTRSGRSALRRGAESGACRAGGGEILLRTAQDLSGLLRQDRERLRTKPLKTNNPAKCLIRRS